MNKIVAAILTLVMVLTMCAAVAEPAYYVMVGLQTADGTVAPVAEDADLLFFGFDPDTNECAFGVIANGSEEMEGAEGTYVISDDNDETSVLAVTMSDGSTMSVAYDKENDAIAFATENGIAVMLNVEAIEGMAEEQPAA